VSQEEVVEVAAATEELSVEEVSEVAAKQEEAGETEVAAEVETSPETEAAPEEDAAATEEAPEEVSAEEVSADEECAAAGPRPSPPVCDVRPSARKVGPAPRLHLGWRDRGLHRPAGSCDSSTPRAEDVP